ncbi:class I SAM-dependent methyltransferase [Gimesia sp.]|uniref:class I SAM-dependent methyltransferase n=1 Tax=Gimesia sp. TaxID=2024833 RepID=UPI003A909A4F
MSITPESLQKEYQLRFGHLADYRQSVWQILCSEFFSKYVSPDARVLDLGAGWCEFINNVKAGQKYAMDLNPDTEKRLSPDIRFLHQDCSTKWDLEPGSLDVVFTSNFLEHLPDKDGVTRTIAQAYECLAPGGCLICLGPNIKFLNGAYWDFYDHYVALTELAVEEVLRLEGFDVELCVDRFLPYSMSQGSTPPLFLLRLYLKFSFLWRFAGKQFLVVGRKK